MDKLLRAHESGSHILPTTFKNSQYRSKRIWKQEIREGVQTAVQVLINKHKKISPHNIVENRFICDKGQIWVLAYETTYVPGELTFYNVM